MRRPMLKCTKRLIPHYMEDVQLASCLVAILLLLILMMNYLHYSCLTYFQKITPCQSQYTMLRR
jgi:hypothetical protein